MQLLTKERMRVNLPRREAEQKRLHEGSGSRTNKMLSPRCLTEKQGTAPSVAKRAGSKCGARRPKISASFLQPVAYARNTRKKLDRRSSVYTSRRASATTSSYRCPWVHNTRANAEYAARAQVARKTCLQGTRTGVNKARNTLRNNATPLFLYYTITLVFFCVCVPSQ